MAKPHTRMVSEITPRRRWARFSLAMIVVFAAVFCVRLAWQVKRARGQREAVEEIVAMGGTVSYDYEFDAAGAIIPGANPPWLSGLVGVDFMCNVRSVSLAGTNARDASLTSVAHLHAVESLRLSGTGITESGIIQIGYRPSVRELYLDGTSVEDTYVIGDYFPSLATLDLSGTRAGKRLKNLHGTRAMRRLYLDVLKIGDATLRRLAGWESLELLSIRGTDATETGITEFQKARPDCEIIR